MAGLAGMDPLEVLETKDPAQLGIRLAIAEAARRIREEERKHLIVLIQDHITGRG